MINAFHIFFSFWKYFQVYIQNSQIKLKVLSNSCCSVTKLCPTLHTMDCSTQGFPVPHHLLEFAQVHVQWISDAIQPSHPLSASSPFAFNLSQHQGLFQWITSSHQAVLKYWSFSISPSKEYSGLISLKIDWFDLFAFQGTVKSATVQKHQLFGTLPSLLCSSTSVHDYWKNHNLESFKHLHCLKSHCA